MESSMINFEEILEKVLSSSFPAEALADELWAWYDEGYRQCSEDEMDGEK